MAESDVVDPRESQAGDEGGEEQKDPRKDAGSYAEGSFLDYGGKTQACTVEQNSAQEGKDPMERKTRVPRLAEDLRKVECNYSVNVSNCCLAVGL